MGWKNLTQPHLIKELGWAGLTGQTHFDSSSSHSQHFFLQEKRVIFSPLLSEKIIFILHYAFSMNLPMSFNIEFIFAFEMLSLVSPLVLSYIEITWILFISIKNLISKLIFYPTHQKKAFFLLFTLRKHKM